MISRSYRKAEVGDIWQYYVDVTLILNLALGYADGGEFTQV
jgi:hypothetical protein